MEWRLMFLSSFKLGSLPSETCLCLKGQIILFCHLTGFVEVQLAFWELVGNDFVAVFLYSHHEMQYMKCASVFYLSESNMTLLWKPVISYCPVLYQS